MISNLIAIKVENDKTKNYNKLKNYKLELLICNLALPVTSRKFLLERDLSSWLRVKRVENHHHSFNVRQYVISTWPWALQRVESYWQSSIKGSYSPFLMPIDLVT